MDGHWVFGGIKRVTEKCFLVEVDKRDSATLIPIIKKYIRPGSTIFSDEWKAYDCLPNIPSYNYVHRTVNHSRNLLTLSQVCCSYCLLSYSKNV